MPRNSVPKPKKPALTQRERLERFMDMAKEVGASEDPKDFDKAFKKASSSGKKKPS